LRDNHDNHHCDFVDDKLDDFPRSFPSTDETSGIVGGELVDNIPPQKSEEEEDNASNKLGSVADKLLTSSASVVPSLGGSTVNSMANVSEVEKSDDVEKEEEEEAEKRVDYMIYR
jgi:hypothetical protein